ALFRAGRLDEALQRPWSKDTKYAHIVWEWFFQGMLRHQAGRHAEARSILEQNVNMIDYMDRDMPGDAKNTVWSDWTYHDHVHVLRSEEESLLRAAGVGGRPG